MVCASLSAFLFAFFANETNSSKAWVIVFAACLFQISDTAAWNVVDIVSSEQFIERRSKATGFGICSATGRLGAFAAQFVNGGLIDGGVTKLLIIDGMVLLMCGIGAVGLDERCRFLDEDEDEVDDEAEEHSEHETLMDFIE